MRHQSSVVVQLRARQHRSALTDSEQRLWAELRGCRLGAWFRRQVPIGRFIVDFLAPVKRLIVEVDGGYHGRQSAADASRERKLVRLGYRVLRIDAGLIETDVHAAVARVRAALHG